MSCARKFFSSKNRKSVGDKIFIVLWTIIIFFASINLITNTYSEFNDSTLRILAAFIINILGLLLGGYEIRKHCEALK